MKASTLILLLLLLTSPTLLAQGATEVTLPAIDAATPYVRLQSGWKYTADDSPAFAAGAFDDPTWVSTSLPLRPGSEPEGWDGSGWFRTRIRLPDSPRLLAIKVKQTGASEIWIDGRRIVKLGQIGRAGFVAETMPHGVVFDAGPGSEHVIAIRYSNPDWASFRRLGRFAGPQVAIARAEPAVALDLSTTHLTSGYLWLFTGVFLAFATLHGLMYAFSPEIRVNLDFALLCVSLAALAYFLFAQGQLTNPRTLLFSEPAMNFAGVGMAVFALRFVHGIFLDRQSVFLTLMVAAAIPVLIWTLFDTGSAIISVFIMMLVSSLEMIRVTAMALWRKLPGARLIGVGILIFSGGFSIGLLSNMGILPHMREYSVLVPFFSVIFLLLSMSLYVSRQFALTNQQLREKLVEVQVLSEQKLAQERRGKEDEYERKLLEVEYERKVDELEEARQLQLSMLPTSLPSIADLEIAAHMETATEVGGDYYDFEIGDNECLTIAVGDATGHGIRAGTMVAAAKSLFGVLGNDADLRDTLHRSTRAIKRMNLRKLSMALTLARYEGGTMKVSAAGMPPVSIFRAKTGEVEQIELHGMPLGSMDRFPYEELTTTIEPGDSVLFMSDGFPERLNLDDEMLGYDRAYEAFRSTGYLSPDEIIESLKQESERWAAGRPPDDDVTFVVLKRKNGDGELAN